jgi:hypothetical protein
MVGNKVDFAWGYMIWLLGGYMIWLLDSDPSTKEACSDKINSAKYLS